VGTAGVVGLGSVRFSIKFCRKDSRVEGQIGRFQWHSGNLTAGCFRLIDGLVSKKGAIVIRR